MTRLLKLKTAFKNCNGPYPYTKFVSMLEMMGYESLNTGKTAGSRRKFWNSEKQHLIMFHAPHKSELGAGTLKALRKDMIDKGVIDA